MFHTTDMMFQMPLLFIGASILVRCATNISGFNVTTITMVELQEMEVSVINKFNVFIQDQLSQLVDLRNAQRHAREIEAMSRRIEQLTLDHTDLLSFEKKLFFEWRRSGKFMKEVVEGAADANLTNAESQAEFEDAYGELIDAKSELLCRKESQLDVNVHKQLKCRYVDHGVPFLRIAPFKEEEAFLEPRIVLYHDVISDEEIETIMILAQPEFEIAPVLTSNASVEPDAKSRIAEIAWLSDWRHEHVFDVSRRVKLMTGLEISTADELQVCHYKPGGFFKAHHDFFGYSGKILGPLGIGDRTATLMFYFNDVKEGGRTVFPYIGVSLKPKKASAAFWYNLLPNGMGDHHTLHAGCPVLYGSKIVANKWLHELGQEFRRPCTLENQVSSLEYLLNFNG